MWSMITCTLSIISGYICTQDVCIRLTSIITAGIIFGTLGDEKHNGQISATISL